MIDEKPNESAVLVFRSIHHPGSKTPSHVYAGVFIRAFTSLMIPIMIVATALVLSGQPVLLFTFASTLVSVLVSSWWTVYRLKSEITSVHISDDGRVAVQSIWEDGFSRHPLEWKHVIDLRKTRSNLFVTLDREIFRFDEDDWPQFEDLLEALRRARLS